MAILDHLSVDNMKKLNTQDMKAISAGAITGTLINSILRAVNIFSDAGRYFGSSFRRFFSKNLCRF